MRRIAKALALAFMLACFCGHDALAAGQETKAPPVAQPSVSASNESSSQDLLAAIKKATFADRYPEYLDKAAFFIRDLLGQFGLGEQKRN